jgi:hypothetical protein
VWEISSSLGIFAMESNNSPVATATSVLFGLFGVITVEAALGEELGKIVMRENSALGQAGVVLFVVLVRSSHYGVASC